MNNRPEKTEYAEFYAGYVGLVRENEILPALAGQIPAIETVFNSIPPEKELYAYAPGKWTIREMLGHLIDAERVFAYRALRFSRGDQTALAGFEENFYVANSNFNGRTLQSMLEEFSFQRKSNLMLFENLPRQNWTRQGAASNAEVSVRALAFIMVGHARHHVNILNERYLNR